MSLWIRSNVPNASQFHFVYCLILGGGIMRELREYLALRLKDSPDSGLQQTIRDNLYRRTVPCKY